MTVWAGPVQFDTAEIVLLIALVVLVTLVPALLGGVIALRIYRRRTPEERRMRWVAAGWFLVGFALGYVVMRLVIWVGDVLTV